MCGICGILDFDGQRVAEDRLNDMCASIHHRGPDDFGVLIEGNLGFGHRRLAILDCSSRGRQPMESASGRYCITYNGEIYNFQDLRRQLIERGHCFRSQTDTEVLVEGLDAWGLEDLLSRLDGIFAFAAWDRKQQKLLAARDPVGVKPFFYSITRNEFVFGSEIRALWAGNVPRQVDTNTIEELLVFRYVAGQRTPYHNIRRLLPGHYLEIENGQLRSQAYWRAIDHVDVDPGSVETWKRKFRQAVADQRVSDVPLGTLLSGGLDSSLVTAELARLTEERIQTFTISVPPQEGVDEWPYAESVAKRWNCKSHKLCIDATDVLGQLQAGQAYQDEPFAFGNDTHIFAISRLAKKYVTVLLSGEGADETLGGYVRYAPVRFPNLVNWGTSWMGGPVRGLLSLGRSRRMRRIHRLLSLKGLHEVMLYNSARLLPSDLRQLGMSPKSRFDARNEMIEQARQFADEPIKQMMLYDMQSFLCAVLDRNDRMTMASSIECRVPFLAVEVVEAALKIPMRSLFAGRQGKKIVRDHAADLLPPNVISRPKWGLGIPWFHYFRNDADCRDFLSQVPNMGFCEMIDVPGLPSAIADFLAGDDGLAPIIYEFFSLSIWWEQIIAPRESTPALNVVTSNR